MFLFPAVCLPCAGWRPRWCRCWWWPGATPCSAVIAYLIEQVSSNHLLLSWFQCYLTKNLFRSVRSCPFFIRHNNILRNCTSVQAQVIKRKLQHQQICQSVFSSLFPEPHRLLRVLELGNQVQAEGEARMLGDFKEGGQRNWLQVLCNATAAWRWSSASSTSWTSAQPTCPWTSGWCLTFNIMQCYSYYDQQYIALSDENSFQEFPGPWLIHQLQL